MLKFRRTIAMFILTLLTCQSVMAGVGEHFATFSDSDVESSLILHADDHFSSNQSDHGQSGSGDLVDTNCCHAHGHCHVLALGCQISSVYSPYGRSFVSSHSFSYNFQYLDPLLRPPASV